MSAITERWFLFMDRKSFLKHLAAIPIVSLLGRFLSLSPALAGAPVRRVRPADPGWPSAASWDQLNKDVGGHLSSRVSFKAAGLAASRKIMARPRRGCWKRKS